MTDDKFYTSLPANNIMAKLTNHVQRTRLITPSTDKHYSLDSEDDFRSGCRNVSHQQQFFSELLSPGRSHNTNYWYSWVQTIYYDNSLSGPKTCYHKTTVVGVLAQLSSKVPKHTKSKRRLLGIVKHNIINLQLLNSPFCWTKFPTWARRNRNHDSTHLTFAYVSAILNFVYTIRSGTDQLLQCIFMSNNDLIKKLN